MAVSKGLRPLAGYPLQFFEANFIASGLWDIIYVWDNRLPSFSQICMLLLQRMYWVILPSLSYGSARFKSGLARYKMLPSTDNSVVPDWMNKWLSSRCNSRLDLCWVRCGGSVQHATAMSYCFHASTFFNRVFKA